MNYDTHKKKGHSATCYEQNTDQDLKKESHLQNDPQIQHTRFQTPSLSFKVVWRRRLCLNIVSRDNNSWPGARARPAGYTSRPYVT